MNLLILWCRDHPLISTLIALLVTGVFAAHLPKIEFDASTKGMMIQGDPSLKVHQKSIAHFGSDNVTFVFLKDDNLFTPKGLKVAEDVYNQLTEIDGVERVDGLFSSTNFKGEDGSISTNPFIDEVAPEEQSEIDLLRKDALRNPLIYRNLISKDGKGITFAVTGISDSKDRNFDNRYSGEIEEVLKPARDKLEKAFQIGTPRIRSLITKNIQADQKTIIPVSALVLLFLLTLFLRSANAAMLPMLTGGLSSAATVGYMALVGIPINVLTVIIPALILVIGSTEDMHIVSEYYEGIEKGKDKRASVGYVARKTALAISLTALTTFLGFFSTAFNDIVMLKQFGIAAAFGLLMNFIITVLTYPAYLTWFGNKKSPFEGKHGDNDHFFERVATKIIRIVTVRKKIVVLISILVAGLCFWGSTKIRVDNNFISYFKKSSEIRTRSDQLSVELSGGHTFNIVIHGDGKDFFKQPENLKKIFRIQRYINHDSGHFGGSTSLADYVALLNREMRGGKESQFRIPETAESVSQYLIFTQRSDIERYVTADFDKANIVVRHAIDSSYEFKLAVEALKKVLFEELGEEIQFEVTGEEILINFAADSMSAGQAQSLTFLIVIIFVMMSLLFVNIKAGLLSIIPNCFPIIVLFGIMGWFGIPLNTGTALIAAIAIGIAVDDTIHFMVRYNQEVKKYNDQNKAIDVTIRSEMRPVLATSISLASGFLVLAASNFVPTIHFGVLSAAVMIVAVATDILITPILCGSTRIVTLWDLVGLKLQKRVIEKSPLFSDMTRFQMKKIILLGNIHDYKEGEIIIRQGDIERCMYLILSGSVDVQIEGDEGQQVSIDQFSEGDVMGEIGLVSEVERTATVRALAPTQVLLVDWPSLLTMRRVHPITSSKLFLNISRILGSRLAKRANELASEISQHSEPSDEEMEEAPA